MFNGDRISVWKDKKTLKMDSDGYTIRMYLIPLTEHSTDGKMVSFIFHIFYQNENESTIYSVLAHTHTDEVLMHSLTCKSSKHS